MAISNRLGYMVLSTGNKSEVSVGYATLYGDMVGGFNVLKDLYKTLVFDLSRWRNQVLPKGALGPAGRVIPERIITKPPTAELKPEIGRDTSELQSLMRISYAVFCLKKKKQTTDT